MGAYDLETESFEVRDEFKLKNIQRVEMAAQDKKQSICGISGRRAVPGYPKSMVLELNRAINLVSLPVVPEKAESYIQEKSKRIPQNDRFLTEETKLSVRDAYIVMNVKIYSYQGEAKLGRGKIAPIGLASLDSIEVYGDRELTNLLYFEDFKRKKAPSAKEEEMRKRYQERLRKHREMQAQNQEN